MDDRHEPPCIRHAKCQYFLERTSIRNHCHQCSIHQENYLKCALRRCNKKDNSICLPSSHANYRFLNPEQFTERMKNMHSLLHKKNRSYARLQDIIAQSFKRQSLPLCTEIDADMKALMEQYSTKVLSTHAEDSFKHIFWSQQLKAMTLKSKRSMRWHPLVIKWCLYLHYRSSGAYETLRKSGIIELPSGRTLRDYRHFVPSSTGFSTAVDQQLLRLVEQTKPSPSLAKNLCLLVDEMYIKEGLIFNKFTGSLTGFVQLDDIGTHLLDYENQYRIQDHVPRRSLAK